MAIHHDKPGEIVDLETWADDQPLERTKAIVKTKEMELARLFLSSGKEIPNHKVRGPIIIHCIKGKVEFTALGTIRELEPGQLLHLMPEEPHAVKAIDDAVVLLTIIFKK